MSGEVSNVGADLYLNVTFRPDLTGDTVNPPSAMYLGLATAAIDDEDTLATITEEDDAGYARQELSSSNMGAPADVSGVQTIKNTATISFSYTNAASSAVTYAFATDQASASSGDIYAWWALTTSKTPGAGDTLQFTANNISMGID